jgi:hypothetical protein
MRHISFIFIIAIATLSLLSTGHAQQLVPLPQHKPILSFVGDWQFTGTYFGENFGAGKVSKIHESCDSLGGFFVVCNFSIVTPQISNKGIGILGYNSQDSSYTFVTYDNFGNVNITSKGTFQSGKWTWVNSEGNFRWYWTNVTPTSYKILIESKSGDEIWKTVMEGQYNRIK